MLLEITSKEQYDCAKQRFSELEKWVDTLEEFSKWGVQQLEVIAEYSDLNTALAQYEGDQLKKTLHAQLKPATNSNVCKSFSILRNFIRIKSKL